MRLSPLSVLRASTRAASLAEYAVLSGVLSVAAIAAVLAFGGEVQRGPDAARVALAESMGPLSGVASGIPPGGSTALPPVPVAPPAPSAPAPVLVGYEFGPLRGVWLPSPNPYITGGQVFPVESFVVRKDTPTALMPGDSMGPYTVSGSRQWYRMSNLESVPGDPSGPNLSVLSLVVKVIERPGEVFVVPVRLGHNTTFPAFSLTGPTASFLIPAAEPNLGNFVGGMSNLQPFFSTVEVWE